MASIKQLVLAQSEEVRELLATCHGFSVESETHQHMVIRAQSKHQAKGLSSLLEENGFASYMLGGNRVRTQFQLHH